MAEKMKDQDFDKHHFRGKALESVAEPDNKTATSSPEANDGTAKTFSEKWEGSRFWLISGSYKVFRSVWMVVIAVGGFIAWLIGMLFL